MTTTRETADHAELAEAHYIDLFRTIREAGRSDSEKANAASKYLASILLSEIAALRVRAEEADALASKHFVALREKQDDAAILKHGKLEAERQRDELRKALETIGEMAPSTCETSLAHDMAQFASQALANQGADQ